MVSTHLLGIQQTGGNRRETEMSCVESEEPHWRSPVKNSFSLSTVINCVPEDYA